LQEGEVARSRKAGFEEATYTKAKGTSKEGQILKRKDGFEKGRGNDNVRDKGYANDSVHQARRYPKRPEEGKSGCGNVVVGNHGKFTGFTELHMKKKNGAQQSEPERRKMVIKGGRYQGE